MVRLELTLQAFFGLDGWEVITIHYTEFYGLRLSSWLHLHIDARRYPGTHTNLCVVTYTPSVQVTSPAPLLPRTV